MENNYISFDSNYKMVSEVGAFEVILPKKTLHEERYDIDKIIDNLKNRTGKEIVQVVSKILKEQKVLIKKKLFLI